MSTRSKTILIVAIAALIAAVAAVGSATMPAKTTAITSSAVAPFMIMLGIDMQRLPEHEIKDGECAERC